MSELPTVSDDPAESLCAICREPLDIGGETFKLGNKGASNVNEASIKRETLLAVSPGQRLHVKCRTVHIDKKDIERSNKRKRESHIPRKLTLRSREPDFRFDDHCFLCGTQAVYDEKHDVEDVFHVRTWDFQTSILHSCNDRGPEDEWGKTVRGRIIFARDLPAVDAIYHQVCSVNFRRGKNIPARHQIQQEGAKDSKLPRLGRRVDSSREEAFIQVLDEFVDNDDEQTTISDLVNRMSALCSEPYSVKYMRKKLEMYLGDCVIITNVNGRNNVVTIRKTASKILQNFYDTPKLEDENAEKRRIIRAAAALIKSDIKGVEESKELYPDMSELNTREKHIAYLPQTLRIFLSELISCKSKDLQVASIGQCIMQQSRPRILLSPLQFGLAVQMHHHFGSRFLIDTLHSHGFCLSYAEVIRFSKCATFKGTNIPTSGHFSHYIADNVDHNVRTLDGRNTFHGMGIIQATTPGVKQKKVIPRLQSPENSCEDAKIAIRYYKHLTGMNTQLPYKKLPVISADDERQYLDMLWKVSWPFRPKRPGWSGMMQSVTGGNHPGQASIHFLPMIDMDPTNMSCIFSTLHYICEENERHGTTPVITFDQPLWWKSKTIITREEAGSSLKMIVLNLGGFHAIMSFLGCIGHVMTSSGLGEVLELAYAENAVGHMLAGKAYARAVRGHFLVDAALHGLIILRVYDIAHPVTESEIEKHCDLKCTLKKFDDLLESLNEQTVDCSDGILTELTEKIEKEKQDIKLHPTGALWVQYMDMVDLLRLLLKAQRSGQFMLYLKTLQQMLPFYAATGHYHYAKSVHLYIQDMLELKETRPDIFASYMSGLFVIRRSNRFWAGLPTDLVIEQTLMRSLKTTGGLTRGSGMEEDQRTRWLLAMPACAEVNEVMQELTGHTYSTSEQHKEMTNARRARDQKDTELIFEFLQDHPPFVEKDDLFNIATGVTGTKTSNPHKAKEVGDTIIEKMEGQDAFHHSFKKKDQIKTLGQKIVTVNGEKVSVDPQLLFQRLLIIANDSDCTLDELFKFELSTHPPALFNKEGLLREPNKPQLADALAKLVPIEQLNNIPERPEFSVIDGGSLLHRLPWEKGTTFDVIMDKYVKYVKNNFKNPTVVFDGYSGQPSTKDATHQKRTKGGVGTRVHFTASMPLKSRKEQFLANSKNKQDFINQLSERMRLNGIKTLHADDDADVLIARTGVDCASTGVTHVIGEDTDILMLLCHHSKPSTRALYFRTEKQGAKHPVWDICCLRKMLGERVCHVLPFIHAICGCDTTSRLFGIGKGSALKKALTEKSFMKQAQVFSLGGQSPAIIQEAGKQALVCLYGGSNKDSLDSLRKRRFREKVVKSMTCVDVQNLPPTSDSAKYHTSRVYYQVMVWMGNADDMNAVDWGWVLRSDKLEPITMDSSPAPESLLKLIRCQCKGTCESNKCSCRKQGLKCNNACGDCQDGHCENKSITVEEIGEIDIDI